MAGKKILLVEGKDDENVLKHVCGNRGISFLDEFKSLGSVENLLESIPVQLKISGPDEDIVGVIVDADTDIAARWESLRNLLIKAGYTNILAAPIAEGTIIDPPANSQLPRIGIWIMPDNQTKGILEDFLRFLVPEGSPLFVHAQKSVADIPAQERRFSQEAEPKALIHTWLAWQEKPGKPLGTAITARYLCADVPQVDVLVNWLNRLFFSNSIHQETA